MMEKGDCELTDATHHFIPGIQVYLKSFIFANNLVGQTLLICRVNLFF